MACVWCEQEIFEYAPGMDDQFDSLFQSFTLVHMKMQLLRALLVDLKLEQHINYFRDC